VIALKLSSQLASLLFITVKSPSSVVLDYQPPLKEKISVNHEATDANPQVLGSLVKLLRNSVYEKLSDRDTLKLRDDR
jgi:hypothetical protein